MSRMLIDTKCPTCQVTQKAERDEDAVPDLDLVPCQGADECSKVLCPICRTQCRECGLHACEAHISFIEGDAVCTMCAGNRVPRMPKPGFTPEEAQAIIEKWAVTPEATITDQEEIETYINGPDDPEGYFSKFDSEAELTSDFKQFLSGYERG